MEGTTLTNRPTFPNPETMRDILGDENADLIRRCDELVAAAERAPKECNDDQTSSKLSDFIKQIDACAKMAERRRVDTKEPALAATRAIDGYFKPISEKLVKLRAGVLRPLEAYLQRKAAEEQRRRNEEAARSVAEAKKAEQVAVQSIGTAPRATVDTNFDAAAQATQVAEDAAAAAAAKPADMGRTRGDYGSVATLRQSWDFEVSNYDVVPLEVLRPFLGQDAIDKAIRAFIRAGNRELAGVKIFQRTDATIR